MREDGYRLWGFQSTRPVKGATHARSPPARRAAFQSTRPVKGATNTTPQINCFLGVSIHAPREGRDG